MPLLSRHPRNEADAPNRAAGGRMVDPGVMDELRRQVARQLAGEGEEAIEDVVQEAVLALHTAGENLPEAEKQDAWLRQVATHKVQDYWRRVERRRKLRERLGSMADANAAQERSPFEWVMTLERSRELHAALRRLPQDDRSLLEDKYLREQSYDQLAAARGTSVKTIEYRLLRARQAIRQLLEDPAP